MTTAETFFHFIKQPKLKSHNLNLNELEIQIIYNILNDYIKLFESEIYKQSVKQHIDTSIMKSVVKKINKIKHK